LGRIVTSPPQPQRKPVIYADLDLGVTGNQVPVANQKRAAANQRQRQQAAEEEQYLKDLDRIHHNDWPDWGKS
jgi:hypothetical protein